MKGYICTENPNPKFPVTVGKFYPIHEEEGQGFIFLDDKKRKRFLCDNYPCFVVGQKKINDRLETAAMAIFKPAEQ